MIRLGEFHRNHAPCRGAGPAVSLAAALLMGVLLARGAGAQTVLIPDGAAWKFFRGRAAPSNPPTAWREFEFEDAAWEEGPTGIGYGDNDDATVLGDMMNGYLTVFCRHRFTVADPATIQILSLSILYDDGFAAYLNGVEVAREQLGAAGQEFAFDQPATGLHEAGATPTVIDLGAAISILRTGDNVLAVEVHNQALASSDLSFKPSLIANDPAVNCPGGFACAYQAASSQINLSWSLPAPADSIAITRNGVPIAGSPFAGATVTAVDADFEPEFDCVYELTASTGGVPCPPRTCTVTCAARGVGTLQCVLDLVDGATQAALTWQNLPGTVMAEIIRENAQPPLATLVAGESRFVDPNVESDMPEDDTEYDVRLHTDGGKTCTMHCGPITLCPLLTCELASVGGSNRVRLRWTNAVKEWTHYIVSRDGVVLEPALAPDAAEYVDATMVPDPGFSYTYTLEPIAPAGEQANCVRTCTFNFPIVEAAEYRPPAGGWDYQLDFEALDPLQYSSTPGTAGNLDGNWIRDGAIDFWDGSKPFETGPAPGGPAPGGLEVVSVPGQGPCGRDIRSLLILDPGNPSAPAGTSLAQQFPDPYDDPSNKQIFLGLDLGSPDLNLLRSGITFAFRARISPLAPSYMNAGPNGDGAPLSSGRGQVGVYFINDGTAPAQGATAACSFAFDSPNGGSVHMSANPTKTLVNGDTLVYRSFWVTVEDPEGDESYDINVYTNGSTAPFQIFSGGGQALQAATAIDFGAPRGNFLAIGFASASQDSILEIDTLAYKLGVHEPAVDPCGPVTNRPPTARIAVIPASGTVALAGGRAEVTLDGSTSDDGDGGAQGLAHAWSKVSGPQGGDSIASPAAAVTRVSFTAPGAYVYRLLVDDRQPASNTASAQTTITVNPETGGSPPFRRGDVDGNKLVEITDVIVLLGFLFLGDAEPPCFDAGDTDDNGLLEITDAIVSLGYQFLGDPPPPAPGPSVCGPDPIADTLKPCSYDC